MYLTRAEVAKLFKIPVRTVDYLTRTGQLPYSRLGKRTVRFSRERLEEWFKERENVPFRLNKSGNND